MIKGVVNKNAIRLISHAQKSHVFLGISKPLFETIGGIGVHSGDTVEFDIDGEVFPSNGTITNYNGLQVECFNSLLNRHEYYRIEAQQAIIHTSV